eukprot:TRINITY_DN17472_c0_g1_i1.p1 TRINITY_DN17472_c0_g1~~TRINITY_DN17472_c0_g1_i1.p1  ORF type:complete len:209 (+),score=28.40 TRINITY_DN17472_c0_g1_i1:36-662(+)
MIRRLTTCRRYVSQGMASLRNDMEALRATAEGYEKGLGTNVEQGAAKILEGREAVLVTGIGKSGKVGERLAVSLRSVGVRCTFVHAAEWAHGDLGMLEGAENPVVVAISHSGGTQEVVAAVTGIKNRMPTTTVLSITGTLTPAIPTDIPLSYTMGTATEPLDSIPTTSVVVQEALANCLVRTVTASVGLTRPQFRANHPGGAIGAKLA